MTDSQRFDVFGGKVDKKSRILKTETIGAAAVERDTGEICIFLNGEEKGFLHLVPEKEPWSENDYYLNLASDCGVPLAQKVGVANVLTGANAGIIEVEVPDSSERIYVSLENTVFEKVEEVAA